MAELDRDELEVAINLIEEDGPLGSLSELYNAISDAFDGEFSVGVIRSRIIEWEIPIQTQAGCCGRKAKKEYAISCLGTKAIFTPRGACPYRLKGTDLDSVKDWTEKIVEHGLQRGVFYQTSALTYFARETYEIFSPEWKTVASHVEAIMET